MGTESKMGTKSKIVLGVISALIVTGILILVFSKGDCGSCEGFSTEEYKQNVADKTDLWIKNVTINNSPLEVASMFCPDGNLVGTVSRKIRSGKDIRKYFDFFAKLPGIRVVNKEYNISQIEKDVLVNTAFITWFWEGLSEPIVARMTFIFRGDCIFQLHSSSLPELNESLLEISGRK